MSTKNFSLVGIADNVQFGKDGGRIVETSENFTLRNAANSADTNLTLNRALAGAGSVTAPSLSFALDSNTGLWNSAADAIQVVTDGTARMTIQAPGGVDAPVVIFESNTAIALPAGTTAQRPDTPTNGMIRYNSTNNLFEGYENGSWIRFSNVNEFADNVFRIFDNGDTTKLLAFEVSGVTTSTTRTVTMVDRNITLDTVTMGSTDTNATAGSILFSTGTKVQQDNANLFWDDTNNRLGVGTATPGNRLDVLGDAAVRANGQIRLYADNNTNYISFQAGTSTTTTNYTLPATDGTSGQALTTNGSGVLSWSTVTTPGALRTLRVAISEGTSGANNLGSALPSGARVMRVRVQVTTAWTGTVSVGSVGAPTELMAVADIDEKFIGFSEKSMDVLPTDTQLTYNNSGTGAGVGVAFVEYIV